MSIDQLLKAHKALHTYYEQYNAIYVSGSFVGGDPALGHRCGYINALPSTGAALGKVLFDYSASGRLGGLSQFNIWP